MEAVRVPGDKSLTHRALLFAALADGRSRIRRPLVGADTESTAGALRALGVTVPALDAAGEVLLDGRGLRSLQEAAAPLDCGNSGTTTRLLMGILAGCPLTATLDGDASLRSRPMRRVTTPLATMGAEFTELGERDRLPIRMRGGALREIHYDSPHASAQVKSAVLLAGLVGGVPVSVTEPLLSRDHTERLLARVGVPLRSESLADGRVRVTLQPVAAMGALDMEVPGDFSSAAFVMAWAALHARGDVRIEGVGLNPARTGFLHVFRRMGGRAAVENERESGGEPVGDVVVSPSTLVATRVEPEEVPSLIDEIPVLAVMAARAAGETTISGAAELRVKESDRIRAVVDNLRAVGAEASELTDGMVIRGTDAPLGGHVKALHDHRIAMAFGLLDDGSGRVVIDDPDVVRVSFPGFWELLRHLRTA
jgi:3-phosphoshikimate 1-carboxyvinyltransferase